MKPGERFSLRIMEADPGSLVNDMGDNLNPHKIGATMFANEKPGGHRGRPVAIGTIDMAVSDAVAKIECKPLFQLLADCYGNCKPDRKNLCLRCRRLLLPESEPRQAEGRDA